MALLHGVQRLLVIFSYKILIPQSWNSKLSLTKSTLQSLVCLLCVFCHLSVNDTTSKRDFRGFRTETTLIQYQVLVLG